MRARSSKRQPKSSPRLFHGPIDWCLVLRGLVIVNRNRLLANDHCELEPPASALLGLERRDLEVGLLCGAARADHRAVRKVKLEPRRECKGTRGCVAACADLH